MLHFGRLVKQFIVENWYILITILINLFGFIFYLVFKRKPKIDIYDDSIYKDLVTLVKAAEEKFPDPKSGIAKLYFVVEEFFKLHSFDIKQKDIISRAVVIPIVEELLSLPSKKG